MSGHGCSELSTDCDTGEVAGLLPGGCTPEETPSPVSLRIDRGDELELWPFPSAVPCARSHAVAVLSEWGLNGLVDDAALVVSELITNAVAAAASMADTAPVLLRLFVIRGWLVIESWDACPILPEPRIPDVEEDSGRGLLIVAALSDACGTDVSADQRKVVWARIKI